jgi:hypothetical protein
MKRLAAYEMESVEDGQNLDDENTQMLKMLLETAVILPLAISSFASSFYSARPEDAKAVYLSHENFSVSGNGIADDTDAVQQAINKVQETTDQGILFVPAGRYRLTRTIYIWPGIRLIGFGATRPTFVLSTNTPGFQQGPAYMFFFAGDRPAGCKPRNLLFGNEQCRH